MKQPQSFQNGTAIRTVSAFAQCNTECIAVYMVHYQSLNQELAINFQGVIYIHSMGVLLLWQKTSVFRAD